MRSQIIKHSSEWTKGMKIHSAFNGHEKFLYGLLRAVKPETYVELGSFTGCSTDVACSALGNNQTGTVYALDAWEGDVHMGKFSKNIEALFKENTKQYSNLTPLKGWFSDILSKFEDETIDVLLIDGQHDYDSIKTDFETWLPKLKKDGFILLHDSAVERKDFGVKQFVSELGEVFSIFQFYHSNGLTVVQKKGRKENKSQDFFKGPVDTHSFRYHFEYNARIEFLETQIKDLKYIMKFNPVYLIRRGLGLKWRI